jgi:DNA-directed RNA polymerase subunit N (RpoN/RPB10)
MIVPVKCPGCGKVIGELYRAYLDEVRQRKAQRGLDPERILYLTADNSELITPEKEVMDLLGINKLCCRNQMMTIVEI